jgi:uncharacterized protein
MKCSYGASVAKPVDRIWTALADVDHVLAVLPGTMLLRSGDAVSGTLKCSPGSAQITYRLSALAEVRETEPHTAVIAVTGKEARGAGTLAATLTVSLQAEGAGTRIEVGGDLVVSGRGEAADDEAWSRVLGRLVDAVVPTLAAAPAQDSATADRPAAAAGEPPPRPARAVARGSPARPAATADRGRGGIGCFHGVAQDLHPPSTQSRDE